jgi:hypothetical protein
MTTDAMVTELRKSVQQALCYWAEHYATEYKRVLELCERAIALAGTGARDEAAAALCEAIDVEHDLTGDCEITDGLGEALWPGEWEELHERIFYGQDEASDDEEEDETCIG